MMKNWEKCVHQLASAAGICHDIGKANDFFRKKLESHSIIADDIRHEWVSMGVVRSRYLDELNKKPSDIKQFFGKQLDPNISTNFKEGVFLKLEVSMDMLLFIIATHHRLLENKDVFPSMGSHVKTLDTKSQYSIDPKLNLKKLDKKITKALFRVHKLGQQHPFGVPGWRMIAIVARAAMILSDQYTSSLTFNPSKRNLYVPNLYANTIRTEGAKPELNQPLEYHLEEVGEKAGDIAYGMLTWQPPGLDQASISSIIKPAEIDRFKWQDASYALIQEAANRNNCPSLILNMAGTGSGKTRMNAKAIVAANLDGVIRFSSAMNLKSLTLQTGDSYAKHLAISKEHMSVVVGDIAAKKMYDANKRFFDDDGNLFEPEYEATGHAQSIPEWLSMAVNGRARMDVVNTSPVLVSTIDWIIAAGDCGMQGVHACALIRCMHSDLILDEVDGYDVNAMAAVLRLVLIAGMFGRTVVASSATLSKHVAYSLYEHYQAGAKMRADCQAGDGKFNSVFISDLSGCPSVADLITDQATFNQVYDKYVANIVTALQSKPIYRLANLIDCKQGSAIEEYANHIYPHVYSLHNDHHQIILDKRVSFGLIRVANIKTAIQLATQMEQYLANVKVCCYHSQLLKIHRNEIEKNLDYLLTRTEGNKHLLADKAMLDIIKHHPDDDIIFIVVATPVEEIGRDHDFDWGIIEPSSTQSIVQTAGRINRHRKVEVNTPNIAILDLNFRKFNNRAAETCFTHPGCETYIPFDTHHASQLLQFNQGLLIIDASLRLSGQHPFAIWDDMNIEAGLQDKTGNQACVYSKKDFIFYSEKAYEAKLREMNESIALYKKPDDDLFIVEKVDGAYVHTQRDYLKNSKVCARTWLTYSEAELKKIAMQTGIHEEAAFSVSVSGSLETLDNSNNKKDIYYHQDFGFMLIKR